MGGIVDGRGREWVKALAVWVGGKGGLTVVNDAGYETYFITHFMPLEDY